MKRILNRIKRNAVKDVQLKKQKRELLAIIQIELAHNDFYTDHKARKMKKKRLISLRANLFWQTEMPVC